MDLNGQTVTGPSAASMYDFTGVTGAEVVIYDSSAAQSGKLLATADVVGAIANVADGNTFTLLSGTLDASGVTIPGSTTNGQSGTFGAGINSLGKVYIHGGTIIGGQVNGDSVNHGGGAVAIYGANAGLLMTDGEINGGFTICGGGIMVQNGAKFTMTGGTVTGGKASYDGGNVFVFNADFDMSGGTIMNGTLASKARYGTNVCFSGTCTFNMTGGTITGGNTTGTSAVGGVYADSSTSVTLSGSPKITGNTCNGTASNLYLNNTALTIGNAGFKSTAMIGVNVPGGSGDFTTGDNVTAAMTKYFTHDGGKSIVFAGNGTPLYCGGYGYQVGYAEGNYGDFCLNMGLAGFGNDAERKATRVDTYGLDIEVLVVTDNEGDTAVICSVESATMAGAMHTKLRREISKTFNIPYNNVMISSNHQHSTPVPGTTDQNKGDYATFNAKFEKLFMDTVKKAILDRAPAEVYTKEVENLTGFNFVRNTVAYNSSGTKLGMVTDNHTGINVGTYSYLLAEAGAGDDDMQLVWFDRTGAKDIVVANFAVHPHGIEQNGSDSKIASANFTGRFRDKVSSAKNCYTMYITGAAGDQNMLPKSKQKAVKGGADLTGKSSLDAYATDLAAKVPALSTSNWSKRSTGQVKSAVTTVTLQANEDKIGLYTTALKIQNAGTLEQRVAMRTSLMSGVKTESQYIYSVYHADAIVNRYNYKQLGNTTRNLAAYAISIGDVSFGGVPYEMFSKDGETVKASDSHPATIICYLANGHNGYLPSTDHMNNGGYSADITYYAKGSADTMNAKLIELLKQVDVAR